MKKIKFTILVCIVLCFSVLSPASAQSYGAFDLDFQYGGPNIKINHSTELTARHIAASNSYQAFGFYTYDPLNGSILSQQTLALDNQGAPTSLGTFAAGTHLGTWITTDKGTFYSSNQFNPNNSSNINYLGDTPQGSPVFGFNDDHNSAIYGDLVYSMDAPGTTPPVGQPLPGILVSGIIGLGIAALARSKQKTA